MSGDTLSSISYPAVAAAAAVVRGLSIFQSLFSRSGFGNSMHRTWRPCCTWKFHSFISADWQDLVLSVPLCIPNHANHSSPCHLMPMTKATFKDRIFSCTDLCTHTWPNHTLCPGSGGPHGLSLPTHCCMHADAHHHHQDSSQANG